MKFATYTYLLALGTVAAQTQYVAPEKRYTAGQDLPECHGNNGPLGINCIAPPCSGTNGPKDGPTGTPCLQDEPADIPHYNTDPTAGRPYATTGDRTRTEAGLGHYPSPANHADYNSDNTASPEPFSQGNFVPLSGHQPITTAYFPDNYPAHKSLLAFEGEPIGTLMAQLSARGQF